MLAACARLDDNLYDPKTKISAYQFDEYTGKVDFHLDSSYDIAPENRTLISLESDDNGDKATTYAVYIGDISRISTDTVIVYCHGNRHHMDSYWPRAKLLAHVNGKHGVGVMMMEFRGFGLATGKPSESGMLADVDAALLWLRDNGLTDERLILYGFSLGTAPATRSAARPRVLNPAKLILESPFASSDVMLQDATQLAIPGSYVTNLKIDNARLIKEVQQPFLWLHGKKDDFLSIDTHGEVVFRNYGGLDTDRTALRIAGAGHSDIQVIMGFDVYLRAVENFINPP